MVLKHNKKFCDIHETVILTGPVLKQVQKESTPHLIYSESQELFDVFADVLTNYAPISINIADFWNKRILDTRVLGAKAEEGVAIDEIPVFIIYDGEGKGYNVGAFLGGQPPSTEEPGTGKFGCVDSYDRFFINSMIGVQDKLAKTYMNSFYAVTEQVKNDSVLRHRLFKLSTDNGQPISELFKNTNAIFSEEKSAATKTFITKKGTELGLMYAGKAAFDAKIQGGLNKSNFNMKITSEKPFTYTVEASILPEIFESFIKPLAHPIGMIYDYKSICLVRGVEDVDRPMIVNTFSANIIQVVCRCKEYDDKLKDPEDPDKKYVFCDDQNNYEYIIATKDGNGLWEDIKEDELYGGNVLADFKSGVLVDPSDGEVKKYKKYILENHNYLVVWSLEDAVGDVAKKVFVEYYRYNKNYGESESEINDPNNYFLVKKWEDKIHCNVFTDMKDTQKSQITEEFEAPYCVSYKDGKFEYIRQGQGALDNPVATDAEYLSGVKSWLGADPDGVYRNFKTKPTAGSNSGGKLEDGPIGKLPFPPHLP